MIRRLTLSFVFVVAGFVAGLVVTGRMHTAADSRAAEAPARAPALEQRAAPNPLTKSPVTDQNSTQSVIRTASGIHVEMEDLEA